MTFRKTKKRTPRAPESFVPTAHLSYRRPCEVDGEPGLFHCWTVDDRALLKINTFVREDEAKMLVDRFRRYEYTTPGTSAEVLRRVFAIVEDEDGYVDLVEPHRVRFTDKEVGDDE